MSAERADTAIGEERRGERSSSVGRNFYTVIEAGLKSYEYKFY
jgi:hypothetical protein